MQLTQNKQREVVLIADSFGSLKNSAIRNTGREKPIGTSNLRTLRVAFRKERCLRHRFFVAKFEGPRAELRGGATEYLGRLLRATRHMLAVSLPAAASDLEGSRVTGFRRCTIRQASWKCVGKSHRRIFLAHTSAPRASEHLAAWLRTLNKNKFCERGGFSC